MRIRNILTLALATLSGMAAAQSASAPAAQGPSITQMQERIKARLMAGDRNHDGKLSKDEFVTMRSGASARSSMDPDKAFARLDKDHDGYLSAGEIDSMIAARLARLDANHDGSVTGDERKGMRGRMGGAGE